MIELIFASAFSSATHFSLRSTGLSASFVLRNDQERKLYGSRGSFQDLQVVSSFSSKYDTTSENKLRLTRSRSPR